MVHQLISYLVDDNKGEEQVQKSIQFIFGSSSQASIPPFASSAAWHAILPTHISFPSDEAKKNLAVNSPLSISTHDRTIAKELSGGIVVLDIVGFNDGDQGCCCGLHPICGKVLKLDMLICLCIEQQARTDENSKYIQSYVYTVYWVTGVIAAA
jgi:hypothetical protein